MTLISEYTFLISDYWIRKKICVMVTSDCAIFTSEAWKDAKKAYVYDKPWYRRFFLTYQLIKFNTYNNEL
jgi:hypothetical protein